MFQVWIWVPTKGWKLVRSFKTLNGAVDCAEEFEPLEVKVTSPSKHPHYARTYYGGSHCKIDHEMNEKVPPIHTLPKFPAEVED